jgi:hypothetical protein
MRRNQVVTAIFRCLSTAASAVVVIFCAPSAQQLAFDSLPVSQFAPVVGVRDIAWGDVDSDGDLDLALGIYNGPEILYYNRGGFLEQTPGWSSGDSTSTMAVAWGDVDADGDLDLATGNWGGEGVWIYFNRDGVLDRSAGWMSAEPMFTSALAWGDMDNDGDLDLLAGGDRGVLKLYDNQGGVLSSHASWTSADSMGSAYVSEIVIADIDNNGYLDAMVGGYQIDIRLYLNTGLALDTVASWSPANAASGIALGDFDGDGYFDLATFGPGGPRVHKNVGGALEDVSSWQSSDSAVYGPITWGDVDGDGDIDLLCGNGVYFNTHGVLESTFVPFALRTGFYATSWADVDADGDLDVRGSDDLLDGMGIYINQTPLLDSIVEWEPYGEGYAECIAWGDVNGDGYPDLAAGNYGDRTMVYFNLNGSFAPTAGWVSEEYNTASSIVWGDIDGDGDQDLAVGNQQEPNRIYYNNNGVLETVASWSSSESYEPDATWSIAMGDADGDGDLDLAEGNLDDQNRLYFNQGGVLDSTAGWSSEGLYETDAIAFCDVERDGDLDLATGTWEGSGVKIHFNTNGQLESAAGWNSQGDDWTSSLVWGDIDGNGYMDLLSGNDGSPKRLYLNRNGNMDVTPSWNSDDLDPTTDVALGDIDCDGDLDLASVDPMRIYINSDGRLATTSSWNSDTTDPDVEDSEDIDWADFDGDGDIDLALSFPELLFVNRRHTPGRDIGGLPNSPSVLLKPRLTSMNEPERRVIFGFELEDGENDATTISVDYSPLGGGRWFPASILEDTRRLPSSSVGTPYEFTWDTDADGVDGTDVWLRIRAFSNPDHVGTIQRPAESYLIRVGRIDGRPRMSLLYPRAGSVAADSLVLIGSVWDATNFRQYRVLLGALPDTATWTQLYTSSHSSISPGYLTTVDLRNFGPGDHVFRTIANDSKGNATTIDRKVTLAIRSAAAPSIIAKYPPTGTANFPGNAPAVIQFNSDMNQAALSTGTFNLYSYTGTLYKDAIYDYSTHTLTLSPPMHYDTSQFHYAVVSAEFQSLQGYSLGSEYVIAFTTSRQHPDNSIIGMSPLRGEGNVPLSSSVVIHYSGSSDFKYVRLFDLGGNQVNLDSSRFDAVANTFTVYPQRLVPKTYYLIRVSDRSSFDGPADYMSYFVTLDSDAPSVVDILPADRDWLVGLQEPVKVIFNKAINVFTVDSSSFFVTGSTGKIFGFYDFSTAADSLAGARTSVSFTPGQSYEPNTRYTVTLSNHIQDNLGKAIDGLSWSFTTGAFDTIGVDGGSLTAGPFTLSIPYGALSSDATIGIGVIPPGELTVDSTLDFTDLAVDLQPQLEFGQMVILSVNVPDYLSAAASLEHLKLFTYDSTLGAWRYLGGTSSGSTVCLALDHMGRYGLFRTNVTKADDSFGGSLTLIPRVISPRTSSFDNRLNVAFSLSQPTDVTARIYDVQGRLMKTLLDGPTASVGENLLVWDGRGENGEFVNDGLYILFIEAEGKREQKTFVIMNR